MPVTKITLSTAMRARDVARPHDEHLAEAAKQEQTTARLPAQALATPPPNPAPPNPAPPPGKASPAEPPAPTPSRRRRRRS